MTLAKAFVSGTVTRAPEERYTQNNIAITGFTINIDKNNETLLRVSAFGQLAQTVTSTITVGDTVAVEGKLQVNNIKLPNGKDRKVFEISASSVEKMGGSTGSSQPVQAQPQSENIVSFSQDETQDLIDEEEIPF